MAKEQGEGIEAGMKELVKAVGAVSRANEGGEGSAAASDPLDRAEDIARLKACAARLAKVHVFTKGQLIRLKKGLKNKRNPAYGKPVIVVEVLEASVMDHDKDSAGTPYFREPLTIITGAVDTDGDFVCYHYDGRRFEPYTE